MSVAVTGGSGVVGSAIVRHLVAAGNEVRALARSDTAAGRLVGLGATPVRGDVLDESSLEPLVRGCETVFHVAGVNELCSRDPGRMWRVNVDGTRTVLDACSRSDVERVVHTSSVVTVGQERGFVADETATHRGSFLSEYERSKWEAERIALTHDWGLDVVSVNPASVQGPGRATGTGELLLLAARGVPLAVDSTVSIVDIDDCARGHLLAADNGVPGQRYLLSGATLTLRDLISRVARLTGGRRPRFVRASVVRAVAPFVEIVFRALGRQTPLCAESARVLLGGLAYDGAKAMHDLGLRYTPIEETLERTVTWFRGQGLL
ncbi:MAG: NAD-dependent epimerase/dehydratase family protein [Acidimicrobiia bacterium]|jgi:dihydroflavonol-4-reductase